VFVSSPHPRGFYRDAQEIRDIRPGDPFGQRIADMLDRHTKALVDVCDSIAILNDQRNDMATATAIAHSASESAAQATAQASNAAAEAEEKRDSLGAWLSAFAAANEKAYQDAERERHKECQRAYRDAEQERHEEYRRAEAKRDKGWRETAEQILTASHARFDQKADELKRTTDELKQKADDQLLSHQHQYSTFADEARESLTKLKREVQDVGKQISEVGRQTKDAKIAASQAKGAMTKAETNREAAESAARIAAENAAKIAHTKTEAALTACLATMDARRDEILESLAQARNAAPPRAPLPKPTFWPVLPKTYVGTLHLSGLAHPQSSRLTRTARVYAQMLPNVALMMGGSGTGTGTTPVLQLVLGWDASDGTLP